MDESVKQFWNEVKDSMQWSGAIVHTEWDDLWDYVKEDVQAIYEAARRSRV